MEKFLQAVYFGMSIVIFQRCYALDGEWTRVSSACIRGHNSLETSTATVEDCQKACEQQRHFRCLSVDFATSGRCLLSRYNRNSVPSTDDFTQPCYNEGWVYSERIDLDFPWSEVFEGCIRGNNALQTTASSMDECQLLCEQETSFLCLSVDFRDEECLLSHYNRESIRPLSDFTQPCYIEGYQYSERTDTKYFWTDTASACIRLNNNEHHEGVENMLNCQQLCLQETSFACLSVDFFPSTGNCYLSTFNRNSVQSSDDFTQPCYSSGGLYAERVNVGQWITIIEDACVSGFNEWSGDIEDFESCKILCSQRSNCCSVDYNRDTKQCLLTSQTRATVEDSSFVSPCNGYSYSERTDVRCATP